MIRILAVLALLASPTLAATLPATPATFAAALAAAQPGDTVQPGPGTYAPGYYRATGHNLPKPNITIACQIGAVLGGQRFDGISGLTITRCTFDGRGIDPAGIKASGDHIVVTGNSFTGFLRAGVEFGPVADGLISGNTVSRSGSDGYDIGSSRRIVVDHNLCMDFAPTNGAHPDCVQLWSIAGSTPTADVTITNNIAVGQMQGISLFHHVVGGVDDGGFDRVTVDNNVVAVSMPDGISVYDCRACTVTNNQVRTLAGAPYVAHLYVSPDSTATVNSNTIGARP